MKVEIYSDIASPWCYIGERRFARAIETLASPDELEVVFRPYQLDPALPDEPMPLRERLIKKFGAQTNALTRHVTNTAAQEGLDFRFDIAVAANTLTAHRLLRLAEREYGPEVQRALAGSIFEAHFTKGDNIADRELLTGLATGVGMDRLRVEEYLASDEGRSEVLEEIGYAQHLGISAVPTFVFDGKYAVQGAQPTSVFLQVMHDLGMESVNVSAESCSDDSCLS